MVFHLGDRYDDMNEFESVLGDKLYRVYGNCDFGGNPKEILVEVEGVRIFATHGDLYGVKRSLRSMPAKDNTNRGFTACFWLILCCARGSYLCINPLARLVLI